MSKRIRVGSEYFYIDKPEDFLALVEQKLGWDAQDYLKELFATIYEYLDDVLDITNSIRLSPEKKVDCINEEIRCLLREIE